MSGIIGLFHLDRKPVDESEFQPMVDVLAHRGPHGGRVWISDGIGLGHQMLRATPEAAEEVYPLMHRSGALVLTADARIDNRKELIWELELPASRRTITDGDLILAAYEKWGERCPEKIVGAFAFAIWDADERRLFCARDHYGLKPFFYSHLPGNSFVFASEAKSVLLAPGVPRQANEVAIAEHLAFPVASDASATFFEHVRRLAPGRFLRVSEDGIEEKTYWELDPERELKLGSDAEYAEALREAFEEAVVCRLRTAAPTGAMLSGGLDSSSIVGVAAPYCARRGESLHTFSAVFDEVKLSDESEYIEKVLERYRRQTTPHFIAADRLSPLTDYETMLWHTDGAVDAGNLYINWALYNLAKKEGVGTIVEGFDGDTTLSHGVGYLHELALNGKWFGLFKEVRAQTRQDRTSWRHAMWKWVRRYKLDPFLAEAPAAEVLRSVKKRIVSPAQDPRPAGQPFTAASVLNPTFRMRMADRVPVNKARPRTEREDHYRLLTRPVMYRTIETLEACAAASGLDLRLPFCDRRLMELCLAMPPRQKRRDGWSRVVMRHAMENILPPDIQWRHGKGNLGPGFDYGLLVLSDRQMYEMTNGDLGGVGRYVNLDQLKKNYPRFVPDRANNQTLLHWRALSLALWLQHTGL